MRSSIQGLGERMRSTARSARDLLSRSDEHGVARRVAALALVIRLGNAALAYVAQVVLARLMGQFEFGVFAYTWVWFMVLTAVGTLGFGDSPIRYIPLFRERADAAHLRGFVRFAFLVTIGTSVALAALLIAFLPVVGPLIDSVYVLPMALMALSVPFACIQSLLEGVGRTYNWTIPSLLPIYILRHGLLLVLMVAAVALGFEATAATGMICLVLTLTVTTLYQATAILLRLRKAIPRGPASYRLGEWLRGSAPFSILHGSSYLSSFADVLVLSFFVSPLEIATYFAATRIIQVVNLVPFAAMVGTAHRFAAAHARGDHDGLQRLNNQVSVATFAIAVAAVAAVVILGHWLLEMFGHDFEAGYTALLILAVGVVARVAAGPAEDMLNMTGHGALSATTFLVVAVVTVGLSIALVIPFGIDGAAIATSVALTGRALWLSVAVRRRLGVSTSIIAALPSWETLRRRRDTPQPAE